jgi:hypothetical protein
MPRELEQEERAEESRPVPSQAEGDEETVEESLRQKDDDKKPERK